MNQKIQLATFAGGCFWCMESPFVKQEGVLQVQVGYTGGTEVNPTYEQVASGKTSHREAVQISYDVLQIDYQTLLHLFWTQIDPTDAGGSFADRGQHYTSAIFYHSEEQKNLAEESKRTLDQTQVYNQPVVTEILPYSDFYLAEDYHQKYYQKNPLAYQSYRQGSGRDQFLQKIWGQKQESQKSVQLTPLQYHVVKQDGTEPAFQNEYWNHHEEGIYVDIVSGEALFCSCDKFDSGTGWPSFTQPITKEALVQQDDDKLGYQRTEVRSRQADSHLGHVFNDGPKKQGGLRYCINSASLKFVAKEDLEAQGYEQYLTLFGE